MRSVPALLLACVLAICSLPAPASDLLAVFQDALTNDPQIRAADATRKAAREAWPQALAALLPQVSGTAQATRDHASGSQDEAYPVGSTGNQFVVIPFQSTADTTTRQWALTLRQNLFSWANWMSLKEANSQVAEAEATYQAAQQSLILRVCQAYFGVLAAIDSLDAEQASLEAISRQLDEANQRFQVGLIAITDVEEAKAARDTAAAAVIAAKRALATAEDQLEEITGQTYDVLAKPGEDMPLASPMPASIDRWVEISMDQNLSLIASRLAADIARDNVRVAFGGHLPTLDIVASRSFTESTADEVYGDEGMAESLPGLASKTQDRQIGLEITVPLFSGGLVQSRVRQAQYQWIAAKEAVVQSSRATQRQARDAYLGVISGIAHVQALRQALKSSEVALTATEAGYEVGTRTAVDLLNARRALAQAQTDYASSRYDYIISVLTLRLAAGNLDRQELTRINGWLTVKAPTTPAVSPTPQALTPPAPALPMPDVRINPTTVLPPAGSQQPAGRQPHP